MLPLEQECFEKYNYHYNGLKYSQYVVNRFAIWGEDVPNTKESAVSACYKILCRMKNFTEQYQNMVCENPQDVTLINEYIKEYSNAYMYVLQNADSMTDEEVYNYLHNFTFSKEMIDLQTRLYHIETPNPSEILTIID